MLKKISKNFVDEIENKTKFSNEDPTWWWRKYKIRLEKKLYSLISWPNDLKIMDWFK